jgi:hypothetical protein
MKSFLSLLTLAACLHGAHATPHTPMAFSTFEPCRGNGSFCATRILASGLIQADTHLRLKQFLATGKGGSTIVFDSPGGNVAGAMELGRLIRQLGLDTAVQLNVTEERRVGGSAGGTEMFDIATNTSCASACTLAFLGGTVREVEDDARFGVHQFSAEHGVIGDSATQAAMTVLALYFEQMGVDRRLLDLASATPPGRMYWLKASDARELRVDTTRAPLAAWRIEADDQGVPSVRVRQELDGGRELVLTLANGQRGIDVIVFLMMPSQPRSSSRLQAFPVGDPLKIEFTANGKTLAKTTPQSPWRRLQMLPDGRVVFGAMALLQPADLTRLGSANQLALNHDIPNVDRDFGASTELSIKGLGGAVGLLLRTRAR